jgi:ribosomal protein L4
VARGLVEGSGLETPIVVVASPDERSLIRSFRNLEKVAVVAPAELEVADILWARSLLVSESALEVVQGRAQ